MPIGIPPENAANATEIPHKFCKIDNLSSLLLYVSLVGAVHVRMQIGSMPSPSEWPDYLRSALVDLLTDC